MDRGPLAIFKKKKEGKNRRCRFSWKPLELFPHNKGRPDGIFTEVVNSACILSSSEPVGGGVQWVGHGIHFHPLEAGHSVQAASVLHQYWWAQSGWSCFGVKVTSWLKFRQPIRTVGIKLLF